MRRVEKPVHAKTFFCPLFEHQKHADVCAVLRAKKICRVNCGQYFQWAQENKPLVETVVAKHRGSIAAHLKQPRVTVKELMGVVIPSGENICEFCGKPFKHVGRLKSHLKKKHRRLLK